MDKLPANGVEIRPARFAIGLQVVSFSPFVPRLQEYYSFLISPAIHRDVISGVTGGLGGAALTSTPQFISPEHCQAAFISEDFRLR